MREKAWSFFVIGMIKKALVAAYARRHDQSRVERPGPVSTITAWLLMLGYTDQSYFDFSGHSDMAVGLGLLFGY